MAVVRSTSGASSVVSRKATRKIVAPSTVQVREIQDLKDTNFGTLDATKDGLIVSYDNASGKFILVDSDSLLVASTDDSNLPDTFITQVESQIDLGDVGGGDVDGGAF